MKYQCHYDLFLAHNIFAVCFVCLGYFLRTRASPIQRSFQGCMQLIQVDDQLADLTAVEQGRMGAFENVSLDMCAIIDRSEPTLLPLLCLTTNTGWHSDYQVQQTETVAVSPPAASALGAGSVALCLLSLELTFFIPRLQWQMRSLIREQMLCENRRPTLSYYL